LLWLRQKEALAAGCVTKLYDRFTRLYGQNSAIGVSTNDRQTVEEELKMKSSSWKFAVALAAVVLCGALMISYAQQTDNTDPQPVWGGHHHGDHMAYMAKALNLTDTQKEQIKSIMQANRAGTRPLMQQLQQNHLAMLTATSGGAFDQAKVTSLANQQAQLLAQLTVQKQSIQSKIYNQVLTPEQRVTADQMRQKQINRINERMQKWSQSGTETSEQ
jgi:Spy/CpxP family protein refolding chaperone